MGISILCINERYNAPYSNWNKTRTQLILACILWYKEQQFSEIEQSLSNELNNLHKMDQFEILMNFIDIYNKHSTFFKEKGLAGVHSFVNKSDCNGQYSVEQSQDILHAINKLSIHIDRQYADDYIRIQALFEQSVTSNAPVIIS